MAVLPTVTVKLKEALLYAQGRAVKLERTQQLEIGEDLFIRIGPGGRKFLLFCLDDLPTEDQAQSIAKVLGLHNPKLSWHQGETLKSLTVIEQHTDQSNPSE